MIYGYARISTKKQLGGNSLEEQKHKLLEAGAEIIVTEQYQGEYPKYWHHRYQPHWKFSGKHPVSRS